MRARVLLVAAAALLAGCAAALNYTATEGPRFGGTAAGRPAAARDTIRVVTFNVHLAEHIDRAITLLREDSALAGADIVALQEMDSAGAGAIAEALGLHWVYYPAARYPNTGRDFGNAILSRYPLREDRKLVLPHLGRGRRSQRIAVAATVLVGDLPVRVYSLHLATLVGNGPNQRRDQLRAVLDDAAAHETVVVAGDFNSETVPAIALERGYLWPTRRLRPTNGPWTFDHVLVRGLVPAGAHAAGVVADNQDASDHRPVWMVLVRDGVPGALPGR